MPGRRRPAEVSAYQRALARLARRDFTQREIERALADDGFSPEEVAAAVERLRGQRHLDDAGFARRFARSRLETHGLGRHRIRQALGRKGVEREVVAGAVEGVLSEVSEAEVLDGVARRYWRQHARTEPPRRLRALHALLLRRGFPASLVAERLRALFPRLHELVEDVEPCEPVDEGPAPVVD